MNSVKLKGKINIHIIVWGLITTLYLLRMFIYLGYESGVKLLALEERERVLIEENHKLEQKIVRAWSYSYVERWANENGFTKANYIYIPVDTTKNWFVLQ